MVAAFRPENCYLQSTPVYIGKIVTDNRATLHLRSVPFKWEAIMSVSSRTSVCSSIVDVANKAPDFYVNVTFADGSRLINHPLDEVYMVSPGDIVLDGMLPRSEHQVKAAMLELIYCKNRLAEFGFFRTLFDRAGYKNVQALALDKQRVLRELLNSTPEHKAAFRRIVSDMDRQDQMAFVNYCK